MHIFKVGDRLQNRYEITAVLSNNTGFGITYKVTDHNMPNKSNRVVKQLKEPTFLELGISPNLPLSEQQKIFQDIWGKYLDLFDKEAKVLAILGEKYDQIPQLFDFFTENNQYCYVQEYIEGESLDKKIIAGVKLPETEVIILLIEILDILEYIQNNPKHNVIHRDIKPENIIRRNSDKKLVLIDFGLVKEVVTNNTQTASFVGGTQGYIAPEIALQRVVSFASDIYAVGMMGVFAITGLDPRSNNDLDRNWQQNVTVSNEFAAVLNKMIAYDYHQRYQNAKEAKIALIKLLRRTPEIPIKLIIGIIISLGVILGGFLWYRSLFSHSSNLQFDGKENKGELTESDQKELATNGFYDVYNFEGEENQTITLEMNSKDFQPELRVITPDGEILKTQNISVKKSVSRLVIKLPKNGKYQVKAKAIKGGKTGNYIIKAWVSK